MLETPETQSEARMSESAAWTITLLRSALENYGDHHDWCARAFLGQAPCSCGFDEALKTVAGNVEDGALDNAPTERSQDQRPVTVEPSQYAQNLLDSHGFAELMEYVARLEAATRVSGEMIPVPHSDLERVQELAAKVANEDAHFTDANRAAEIFNICDRWLTPAPKGETK